jgi:SWI/SNF-related matrix-associated actin-dependent regulator of chromatin subfamily A member 5
VPGSPTKRRERAASGGASDDEGGEGIETTRLTVQPTCIKGSMRPYQLEGLNWMIKLQENGVNG